MIYFYVFSLSFTCFKEIYLKNNKTIIFKGSGNLLVVGVSRKMGFGEQGRDGIAGRKNISKGM